MSKMQVDCDDKTAEDQRMSLDNASAGSSTGSNEETYAEGDFWPYNPKPINSIQQLSNAINAFTELASTGFSFGSTAKEGKLGNWESNNGKRVIQSPSVKRVPVEYGEEVDQIFHAAEAALYELYEAKWKERGKGEVQINCHDNQMSRFVMRTHTAHELILNTKYESGMKVNDMTIMDDRCVIFQCINGAAKGETTAIRTYALKFKCSTIAREFCNCFTVVYNL